MKKVNAKGFTLIELLAVIVIMGILMLVAIPNVRRTIENSRKDTFVDIAKSYANAATTLWAADGLACSKKGDTTNTNVNSAALDAGTYYIEINSQTTPVELLQSGGKSSWGNRNVKGFVKVTVDANRKTTYNVALSDGTHYINDSVAESLVRGNVKTDGNGSTYSAIPTTNGTWTCVEM